MSLAFQWDVGNTRHIIDDYPQRGNTTNEVESLFSDPNFRLLPDRIDDLGEQRYKAVALSNLNRILYVAFAIRNGHIRPVSCRPASRKERERYAQIAQKSK